MALHSLLKYSTAGRKARLESFRLSTLILEPSGAADAERPRKEGPARPGWNPDQISFTCHFHLASLLACTKLASAQETNTLERDPFQRPIWYYYFNFPLPTLGDLSRRPRPLGPRLPAPRAAVGKASGPDRRLQSTVPQ